MLCPRALATARSTSCNNAGSFLEGRFFDGVMLRGVRYGASVSRSNRLSGIIGSSAANAAAPLSGLSSQIHPVMPIYRPRSSASCTSFEFPVKQWTTPGTERRCFLFREKKKKNPR